MDSDTSFNTKSSAGQSPSILVVIVLHEAAEWVEFCLAPLVGAEFLDIVCVDNASSDETVSKLLKDFPSITLICSEENLGFGRANNLGIDNSLRDNHQHIFLLNQDARIAPEAILELAEIQSNNPSFGVVSPLHFTRTEEDLDPLFSSYLSSDVTPQLLSDLLLRKTPAPVYATKFVNAALWLISSDCLSRVGVFDPRFPHYSEDDDYVRRVRIAGFLVGICPGVMAEHVRGYGSGGRTAQFYRSAESRSYSNALLKMKYGNRGRATQFLDVLRAGAIDFFKSTLHVDPRGAAVSLRVTWRLVCFLLRESNKGA